MRSVALLVMAIASASVSGCASPCVDDRCSVKSPLAAAAEPPAAPEAPVAPVAPPPDAAVAAPAAIEQGGVIYAGAQLTIRYAVQANQADPSLADIAFTYVNQSPGVAAVQFAVQGRDGTGKELWTRRLGTTRLNAAATAAATVTTALSTFPLSITVADVKLCPIAEVDPAPPAKPTSSATLAPSCAQVEPAKGDTAQLQRPPDAP